jgi:hypothetical protein
MCKDLHHLNGYRFRHYRRNSIAYLPEGWIHRPAKVEAIGK